MNATATSPTEGLLNAEELLKAVWPNEKSRPSIRWLREQQEKRTIPFIRLGRLVFFDVDQVSDAIRNRHTVAKRQA